MLRKRKIWRNLQQAQQQFPNIVVILHRISCKILIQIKKPCWNLRTNEWNLIQKKGLDWRNLQHVLVTASIYCVVVISLERERALSSIMPIRWCHFYYFYLYHPYHHNPPPHLHLKQVFHCPSTHIKNEFLEWKSITNLESKKVAKRFKPKV